MIGYTLSARMCTLACWPAVALVMFDVSQTAPTLHLHVAFPAVLCFKQCLCLSDSDCCRSQLLSPACAPLQIYPIAIPSWQSGIDALARASIEPSLSACSVTRGVGHRKKARTALVCPAGVVGTILLQQHGAYYPSSADWVQSAYLYTHVQVQKALQC